MNRFLLFVYGTIRRQHTRWRAATKTETLESSGHGTAQIAGKSEKNDDILTGQIQTKTEFQLSSRLTVPHHNHNIDLSPFSVDAFVSTHVAVTHPLRILYMYTCKLWCSGRGDISLSAARCCLFSLVGTGTWIFLFLAAIVFCRVAGRQTCSRRCQRRNRALCAMRASARLRAGMYVPDNVGGSHDVGWCRSRMGARGQSWWCGTLQRPDILGGRLPHDPSIFRQASG